jgi:hypothetical protein
LPEGGLDSHISPIVIFCWRCMARNIAAEKAKLEAQIAKLKPGPELDALRRKIRQLDTAAHLGDWLSSPGLQPLQKPRTKAPTAGTNGALPRYARRTDLRGSAMTAERIFQAAIFGLFIFSVVLASMLILNS